MAKEFASYVPAQLLYEAALQVQEQFDRLQLQRFGGSREMLDQAVKVARDAIADREGAHEVIEAARCQASDELEIDDVPFVSGSGDDGDPGVWVAAWLWVPK